jgi:hypothetical protein
VNVRGRNKSFAQTRKYFWNKRLSLEEKERTGKPFETTNYVNDQRRRIKGF